MAENIKIPFNDVFFYGVSLNLRDVTDVRTDIFANILMRYLRTLKPVSSKLYRTADGNKYEYSYSFIPTKPLNWRVIKNRRVIEDIEQLSEGKYCLNYYDDQGRDVKCVLFNKQHKWQKTNYYNSISGNDLLCSVLPKEKNGETVILQYITGETYPITLYCCPAASCQEVLDAVLSRVPSPDATALTNYGLLYFAKEETLNIYKQILKEEEDKYAQLHKPEIFTTEEDVAGGFCFDVSNFDSTKAIGSMFDLSEAEDLSDEGFIASDSDNSEIPVESTVYSESESAPENRSEVPESLSDYQLSEDGGDYSLDADISEAIKIISDITSVQIDESIVFGDTADATSASDFFDAPDEVSMPESAETDATCTDATSMDQTVEPASVQTTDDNLDSFVISASLPLSADGHSDDIEDTEISEDAALLEENSTEKTTVDSDSVDLLTMKDEDIDDYVQALIDSLLLDAKTVSEYKDSADNAFTAGGDEAAVEDTLDEGRSVQNLITDTPADVVIESNGAEYHYYGDTDAHGKRIGRGKTLMSDGKTAYDGEYRDDMRHGVGSFYYKDGSLCYWGDWVENLRNGFGVGISSETGTVHIGSWQRNKPTGIGVRFDKDGRFMYIDSACQKTNGGIRITGFTEKSIIVEYWDENSLRTIKKEISLDDLS